MGTPSLAISSRSTFVARIAHLFAKGIALAIACIAVGLALPGCFVNGGSDPAANAPAEGEAAESAAELRVPRLRSLAITPRQATIGRGAAQSFTATGTFSNGQHRDVTALVTWKSSNARVATISNASGSKGVATGRAFGRAIITAHLEGRAAAATLTVTDTTLVSIIVSPGPVTIANGTSEQFTATGVYSDGSVQDLTAQVTWASTDPSVAVIEASGLAFGIGIGSTTIVATFDAVSGSTTLTVSPAVLLSIQVAPTNPSIPAGVTQQFTAVGTYSDGSVVDLTPSVVWSSSNEVVATIDNAAGAEGLAAGLAPGITTVVATFSAITGSTTLTVTPATLVAIAVVPVNASIPLGFAQAFTAIGTFTDNSTQDVTAVVAWTSSDVTIAVVSNDATAAGQAFGLSVGTAVIEATLGAITGTTTITVTPAILTSIFVLPVNREVPSGTSLQFVAVGSYSDGSTIDLTSTAAWASSDANVATIDDSASSKGLALAVSPGAVSISATVDAVSGTTTLIVSP